MIVPGFFIRANTEAGDSYLSLCCGIAIELRRLPGNNKVTAVDIVPEYLAEVNRLYPEYTTVLSDAVEFLEKAEDDSYDIVSCIDGIEHLKKEDGIKLLTEAKRVAKKKVFIFTPEGYVKNEPKQAWGIDGGDHYQVHLSGWVPEEFTKHGYTVAYQNPAVSQHGEPIVESMYLYEKPCSQ